MNSVLYHSRMRKRRRHLRRLIFWLAGGISLFVGILFLLLFSSYVRVRHVTVGGATTVEPVVIEEAIHDMFGSFVYGFIPQSNIFFLATERIQNRLMESFPQMASADVTYSFRHGLHVEVVERARWALYCRGGNEATPPPCYYIDDQGVAYAIAPSISGDIMLRINDEKNKTEISHLGSSVVEQAVVEKIQSFLEQLKKRFSIRVYEVFMGNEYPSHLVFGTEEGWRLITEFATVPETSLDDLALVFEKQVKDRRNLEYVDVRFAEKVFYKYR